MLLDVMAHYGLTKDFRHAGFFETEQHKRIFRQLKTAIPNGYLIAVSGIVGSGKTTTLRRLQEILRKENKVIVSKSLSVEKRKTTLKTLICALFYDVSGDKDYKVATVGEKRERELQELIRSGKKTVALFVDEAHDLHQGKFVLLYGCHSLGVGISSLPSSAWECITGKLCFPDGRSVRRAKGVWQEAELQASGAPAELGYQREAILLCADCSGR